MKCARHEWAQKSWQKNTFYCKSYVILLKKFLKTILFCTLPCNKVISIMYIFTFFVLVNRRCVKINDDGNECKQTRKLASLEPAKFELLELHIFAE